MFCFRRECRENNRIYSQSRQILRSLLLNCLCGDATHAKFVSALCDVSWAVGTRDKQREYERGNVVVVDRKTYALFIPHRLSLAPSVDCACASFEDFESAQYESICILHYSSRRLIDLSFAISFRLAFFHLLSLCVCLRMANRRHTHAQFTQMSSLRIRKNADQSQFETTGRRRQVNGSNFLVKYWLLDIREEKLKWGNRRVCLSLAFHEISKWRVHIL